VVVAVGIWSLRGQRLTTRTVWFRAPQYVSYQWSRDGVDIGGATGGALTPHSTGEYTCTVTAQNQAGSSTQTSKPLAIFKVGKPKLNNKRGTATISITAHGAGAVKLVGKNVSSQRSKIGKSTRVKLTVKPKGRAKRSLKRKGKVAVKVTITFTPTGGTATSQNRSILLKRKR
jgi:hypothetical protein